MLRLIRGTYNFPTHVSSVVTIGNFDGLHLGHQALIKKLILKANALLLPSVVVTFEPQPNEYFAAEKSPARLTKLREKIQFLKTFPIDYLLCLRFDAKLAELSAEDFVNTILHQTLNARYVLVGDDFRFGKQRKGDIALLQSMGKKLDFTAEMMPSFFVDGQRVSSTLARRALENDQLEQAEKMLGRPYGMCGRVVHGDKRGRLIGFPTANLFLHRKITAIHGVYAVKVYGITSNPLFGVANIGRRPTLKGQSMRLEVHLFDFNQDIYGKSIYVEFIEKIRNEMQFSSIDALCEQIKNDALKARKLLQLA